MSEIITKKARIPLISLDEGDNEFYRWLMSDYKNVTSEVFTTIKQLKNSQADKIYSGFIVDKSTLDSFSTEDKEFLRHMGNGFPVLNISRDSNNNINCYMNRGKIGNLKGKKMLDYFIRNDCMKMIPRKLRLQPRKKIFFNASFYYHTEMFPVKTNLWDISEGGCFIISGDHTPRVKHLWLSIEELIDQTQIFCEIRWVKSWGRGIDRLPGYGISFKEISQLQRKEIRTWQSITV